MSLLIQDIYRIHNKRVKTYRKIWYFFYDISQRYKNNDIQQIDYLTSDIKREYWIDPRTAKKYFWQFLFTVSRKNVFIFKKEDIILINQIVWLFKDYANLPTGRQRMSKYVIYFLLQQLKWVK